MGSYVPGTEKERQEMLQTIGCNTVEELFAGLPEQIRLSEGPDLPEGKSEQEVMSIMEEAAGENRVYKTCFRGAGAYRHYIPAIVRSIVGKEVFKTAYTPYQPELSQGILQSIFEYQTMICRLTGMDVSNASVYDGATAAAEGVLMCKDRKKDVVFISGTVDPKVKAVVETYCDGQNVKTVTVPVTGNGMTDIHELKEMVERESGFACLYVEQPNYYGIIEDIGPMEEIVHGAKGKLVMGCEPVSLAMLKTPGEYGADVAVGEGQPLGLPLSFGGPYLGFMAAKKDMMRKLPGRMVGETKDADGNKAYVLTLQAREQHIRREKAGSNICSNQAHCALTAGAYMAAMGTEGMKKVAGHCTAKAHYLAEKLTEAGLETDADTPFFNEFVTKIPEGSSVTCSDILKALDEKDILGGLELDDRSLLWCATEVNTEEEIRTVADTVKQMMGKAGE